VPHRFLQLLRLSLAVCAAARVFALSPAIAAASTLRTMTLAEALAYARVHQPSLRSALARVSAAAAETRIARAQWLPVLGATAQVFEGTTNNSTASYLGARDVDLPRIGGTPANTTKWGSLSTSTLGAIGAGQELYDFGRISAQAAVADAAYQSERLRADSERLRIDLLVREGYYAVEGAKAILRAAEDASARAHVHRDMAAAAVKSGLHAPIELTRAEADLTRFDVGRIRAAGGLHAAQAALAAAVGVNDRMLDTVGEAAAAAPVPPLDDGLKQAIARDPSLQAARSRVTEADALTRAIGAELRPDLALTASLSARAGTAPASGSPSEAHGPLPTIPNWDVGLVLRWAIYDPIVVTRRDAARSRIDVGKADVDTLTQEETAAVEQAYVSLEVASAALVSLARAIDAAHANYAQAEARFKAGLGTSLELADAEAVRTDAEIQLAVGRFDVLRARAALTRFMAEGL
jgi:outer membrane protein